MFLKVPKGALPAITLKPQMPVPVENLGPGLAHTELGPYFVLCPTTMSGTASLLGSVSRPTT